MITKGVIAAAGRGTRFFPVAKAVPKEMLPIVDRPIIQYIVEEFAAAGVKEIVIVTNTEESAAEKYFRPDKTLEAYLRRSGKREQLRQVQGLSRLARFRFVRQSGPYGNGTACLAAEKHTAGKPFVFAFGDDLVLSRRSFTARMLASYRRRPGLYMGVQEVRAAEVVKYGIVEPAGYARGRQVKSLVEKPPVSEAPSRLAVFGRYILPPEIFPALRETALGRGGELWMADAVQNLISKGVSAYYQKVEHGRWYTTGDPAAYLAAVRAYALSRRDYAKKLKDVFVQN